MRIDNLNGRSAFVNSKQLLIDTLISRGNDAATVMETVKNAKLTSGTLRTEVAANTTQAAYKFPVVINNSTPSAVFNTMVLLPLQDWFIVEQIGVFAAKTLGATDATFALNSFPDAAVFTTANTAVSLYCLYNGNMSLIIDNNVVVNQWDIQRHLLVPTQQTAAAAYYTGSTINYKSEQDGSTSGFYPCEPLLVFNGAANIDFSINMPAAFTAVESNQRIVVILRGIRVQNVTGVK